MENLVNYNDIYFDRATGKTYIYQRRDGSMGTLEDESERPFLKLVETPFTFESATWSGTFGWITSASWPWLHPLGFATMETAKRVLEYCKNTVVFRDPNLGVYIYDKDRVTGPFRRTIEKDIQVANHKTNETHYYSAGRIAERIIRRGIAEAMQGWVAEVKASGVIG